MFKTSATWYVFHKQFEESKQGMSGRENVRTRMAGMQFVSLVCTYLGGKI